MGRDIIKPQSGQRISSPETDPNPNVSRTAGGPYRDDGNEMDSPDVLLVGYPLVADSHSRHFTFAPPKTGILKFWDSAPRATCSRSARSGAVCVGMGVRMPEPKRAQRRRIRRPGAASRAGSSARVEKIRVRRGEGGRISGIQFSKKADPQKASVSG